MKTIEEQKEWLLELVQTLQLPECCTVERLSEIQKMARILKREVSGKPYKLPVRKPKRLGPPSLRFFRETLGMRERWMEAHEGNREHWLRAKRQWDYYRHKIMGVPFPTNAENELLYQVMCGPSSRTSKSAR